MTNIEKIVADGKIGLFLEMQKGDNALFCEKFGIPMRPDTSYDLEGWMLSEVEKEDETMTVKELLELYDNWNDRIEINEDLELITKDKPSNIYENMPNLCAAKVIAFGHDDGALVIRVSGYLGEKF